LGVGVLLDSRLVSRSDGVADITNSYYCGSS
jgi:hypothetical protein